MKSLLSITLITAVSLAAPRLEAATLDASTDVWLRSTGATTTFEDDAISVRHPDITGDARYGIVEFDLSTAPNGMLASAALVLTVRSNADDVAQDAFLIDTSGGAAASSLTWQTYQSEHEGQEAYDFAGLGEEPFAAAISAGSERTTLATVTDLAQIQTILNNDGLLTIALKPRFSTTNVDWTDTGLDGIPPRLELTYVPEPSCIILCGLASVAIGGASRRLPFGR